MANIKNLLVRLGIDFDDSGVSRFTKGLDRVAGRVTKLSGAMDKMRGPAMATGFISAAGAATSFGAALVPVSAAVVALPAAMAISKVAMGTFKVATIGVGDALSAVAEGDAKKLEEALKKLSPNARAFVNESKGFVKSFEPIRKAVQDKLFDGLGKGVEPLSKNLLPTAKKGMLSVAGATNSMAKEAIKFGSSPMAKGALNAVFKTTSSVMKNASTAVQPLLAGVSKLVVLGLPLAKRMADWAINGVKTASAFLTSARGSQWLSDKVKRAGDLLTQLGRIGKNLAVGLGLTFSQANANSSDFLGTLERMTAKFAAWAKSAQGQQQAANAFKLLGDVAKQLAGVLPIIMGPLGAIAKIITTLPPDIQGVVTTGLALAVVVGTLGGKLTVLGGALIGAGSKVVQFAGGMIRGSAALGNNATMAAKAGAGLRSFAVLAHNGIMTTVRMTAALSAQAGAWLLNTTRTVASTVAQKAAAVASKAMAAATWLVNAAMRANPIGLIITLITGLVAIIVVAYKKNETFRKIVDAVWKGIRTAISYAWNNVLKPAFTWIYNFIVRDLGPKFLWLHNNVVRPAFQKIGQIVSSVWNNGLKPVFMFLAKTVTQTIPNAFRAAVTAIGRAWDKVKEVAKAPVRFVVNTVYNGGIARIWNWIADKTNLGRLPTIQGFATGGVLPGYSRKDNQLIAARSGESIFVPEFTKAVGPDWVYGMNSLARRGGPRAVVKAMTGDGMGIPAFENGGIVGAVTGFFAKAKEFFVNGFIKAAKAALNPIINVARGAIGGTPFGSMLVNAVQRIVDGALNAFKPYESELGGGGATGVVKAAARYIGQGDRGRDNDNRFNDRWGFPAGTPWCANFVSTAVSDAKAGKRYPGFPTAAVYGYWSRMKKVGLQNARPGDLGVYYGPTGHINIVSKKLGGNAFETIGGNEGPVVRRAVRSSAYAILRPSFERGGIFDVKDIFKQRNEDKADRRNPMRRLMAGELKPFKFDNGGVWKPGTVGVNLTREPEYVFTRRQMQRVRNNGDTINQYFTVAPGADIRAFGKAAYEAIKKYKDTSGKNLEL